MYCDYIKTEMGILDMMHYMQTHELRVVIERLREMNKKRNKPDTGPSFGLDLAFFLLQYSEGTYIRTGEHITADKGRTVRDAVEQHYATKDVTSKEFNHGLALTVCRDVNFSLIV